MVSYLASLRLGTALLSSCLAIGLPTGIAAAGTPATPTATTATGRAAPWWQHAVIYEIYPRSFQDSDGDGVGDINGITARLDYLSELGVDAIWITPVYPSPQVDFGYDVSDYEAVDPQFGTLADIDRLISEAGRRHIRVLMDMVLNHTSDKHRWFIESASSRDNPKRDWYVWQDGKGSPGSAPPNNWQSIFGHSAWTYEPRTAQYYYHKFYAEQPDLNWRNPAVEAAMFQTLRFWLDRGVAGFRLDAIPELFEDPSLADERVKPGTNAFGDANVGNERTSNRAEVHAVIRRMRALVDAYPGDRVLIGETYLPDIRQLDRWYGGARHDELQLPMDMNIGFSKSLDALTLRRRLVEVQTGIHGSEPLLVFDNHDNARSWNRFGDGTHDLAIAKLVAALLLTTRDTALLYYGQELGMSTTVPTRVEDVKDPVGVTGWPRDKGRDGERTPMQWDATAQSGFTAGTQPWLPVATNHATVNVATERADPASLWNWYRQLIALRKADSRLADGRMAMLDGNNPDVLSYERVDGAGGRVVVALNLSAQSRTVTLPAGCSPAPACVSRTLLSAGASADALTPSGATRATRGGQTLKVSLEPFASYVGVIEPAAGKPSTTAGEPSAIR